MKRELEVAIELARRAGRVVLDVYAGAFEVEQKAGGEGPVTRADREADALVREGLVRAFPGDAVLSEETPDDLARLAAERLWLVDPLDGTEEFVRHEGEFAVMIGLAVRGEAVLGVIHLPLENRTVIGARGEGAWEIGPGDRRRLVIGPPVGRSGPVVAISRSHTGPRTRRLVELLRPERVIRSGSVGRKAVLVVRGDADVYVGLGRHSRHWDACAADAIVRGAGGFFGDALGRPIRYNTRETRNLDGLMAARRELVPAVVDAVRRALAEPPVGEGLPSAHREERG